MKFIHNMVRKGRKNIVNIGVKNYYIVSSKSLRIMLTDKCKRQVCNNHQIN